MRLLLRLCLALGRLTQKRRPKAQPPGNTAQGTPPAPHGLGLVVCICQGCRPRRLPPSRAQAGSWPSPTPKALWVVSRRELPTTD